MIDKWVDTKYNKSVARTSKPVGGVQVVQERPVTRSAHWRARPASISPGGKKGAAFPQQYLVCAWGRWVRFLGVVIQVQSVVGFAISVGLDLDGDVRFKCPETGQPRHQPPVGDGLRRRDAQSPPGPV